MALRPPYLPSSMAPLKRRTWLVTWLVTKVLLRPLQTSTGANAGCRLFSTRTGLPAIVGTEASYAATAF
jgi:hypothetical protein